MSAGRAIAARQASGSQVNSVLNPVRGYRDELSRKGVKPRDHMRENARALRKESNRNRVTKELNERDAEFGEEAFKMKQFEGIEARVLQPSRQENVKRHDFVRRGSGAGAGAAAAKNAQKNNANKPYIPKHHNVKPAVPKADEVIVTKPSRPAKNFIAGNRNDAMVSKAKPAPAPEKTRRTAGEVPAYLKARKQQWAREESAQRAAQADPECPPGMCRLSEEERLETLAILKTNLANAKKEMSKMPLLIETQGQKNRQNKLDAKIKELEDAVGVFSRKKVFVRDD